MLSASRAAARRRRGRRRRSPSSYTFHVTSKSPGGDISVVTLIRTDATLDHSQKAEKVYTYIYIYILFVCTPIYVITVYQS